jgi:ribonuclease HI
VTSDHDALYQLELALARRDETAIPGGYAGILDHDFFEIGASGRLWTRPETLAALAAAPTAKAVISGFEVARLGTDALLAAYRVRVAGRDGTTRHSLRSSIWVRREGSWRLRFNQGTPVPPEAG